MCVRVFVVVYVGCSPKVLQMIMRKLALGGVSKFCL